MNRLVFICSYWLPVCAWAGLIACLSAIPSLETGAPGLWDLILRKLGHALEYAILTFWLGRALHAHGLSARTLQIWSASLALAYAISDELHQTLVPGREGHIRDVLIDGLGVGAWVLLSRLNRSGLLLKLAGPQQDE